MNITNILSVMDFTPEEDRALLYSTSATLIVCCVYKGFFLTKKICGCLAQKYANKKSRITVQPEPFEDPQEVV